MRNKGLSISVYVIIALAVLGLLFVYKTYNPLAYAWFPKCPLKSITGLECAGCGSQRSFHFLLNGEFKQAFQQNALLLPFLPYLAFGYLIQFSKNDSISLARWRKCLYGATAIKIIAILLLGYTIYRNWLG